MTAISIHKVKPNQAPELQKIGQLTFLETFASDNKEDDMQQYLKESFAEHKLYTELHDINTAYYFAQENDSIIGYLKLNTGTAQSELKDHNSLEIERIYVLKAYQGHKIGQLLYEKAIAVAVNKEVDFIWLGVWEENHKAINFYTKNGFEAFDKHIFKLGDDEQTDIMMRLTLINK